MVGFPFDKFIISNESLIISFFILLFPLKRYNFIVDYCNHKLLTFKFKGFAIKFLIQIIFYQIFTLLHTVKFSVIRM